MIAHPAAASGAAPPARLRADAQRNRERIVAAARDALVEQGAEVAFDEIARRAGVGNATLYRHFPDRADLIRHIMLYVMGRLTDRAAQALDEEPDAFQALRIFAHAAVEERIGALCPLLSDSVDRDHPDLLAARDRLHTTVEGVMAAASASGLLRTDIGVGDLLVAISQLTRPLPGGGCQAFDSFAHRHLQLLLDGLMAPARSELPGTAFALDDLREAAVQPARP